jgi:hypothetical protein
MKVTALLLCLSYLSFAEAFIVFSPPAGANALALVTRSRQTECRIASRDKQDTSDQTTASSSKDDLLPDEDEELRDQLSQSSMLSPLHRNSRRYQEHVAEEEALFLQEGLEVTENDGDDRPRLQLPARFARPGVGWKHHHEATMKLMQGSDDDEESDKDNAEKKEARRSNQESNNRQTQGNPVSNFFKQHILKNQLVSSTPEWKRLQKHAEQIQRMHLRDLLQDTERCDAFFAETDGVYVDYARQCATPETMSLLNDLAETQELRQKMDAMVRGDKINFTEKRAVLHTALRASRDQIGTVFVDGDDAIGEVHEVLDQIKAFTEGVRSGSIRGSTGKRLRNIVSVGIGGSYLGPEFLHESLKTEPEGINAALGYSLRFLSNVDPVDVERTCADLDPEETLIVIVSKTFTTAETMLNARTMRQWLWDFMGNDKEVVRKHVVACASVSSIDKVADFGIDTDNYFFRFWDWVGGRYSVCSAAGAVPISLLYGYDLFEKFLQVRLLSCSGSLFCIDRLSHSCLSSFSSGC